MTGPPSRVQQCEHLLYGSVTESNLPALLHRLRGLCDFATEGGNPFKDREIALKIGGCGNVAMNIVIFLLNSLSFYRITSIIYQITRTSVTR